MKTGMKSKKLLVSPHSKEMRSKSRSLSRTIYTDSLRKLKKSRPEPKRSTRLASDSRQWRRRWRTSNFNRLSTRESLTLSEAMTRSMQSLTIRSSPHKQCLVHHLWEVNWRPKPKYGKASSNCCLIWWRKSSKRRGNGCTSSQFSPLVILPWHCLLKVSISTKLMPIGRTPWLASKKSLALWILLRRKQ